MGFNSSLYSRYMCTFNAIQTTFAIKKNFYKQQFSLCRLILVCLILLKWLKALKLTIKETNAKKKDDSEHLV